MSKRKMKRVSFLIKYLETHWNRFSINKFLVILLAWLFDIRCSLTHSIRLKMRSFQTNEHINRGTLFTHRKKRVSWSTFPYPNKNKLMLYIFFNVNVIDVGVFLKVFHPLEHPHFEINVHCFMQSDPISSTFELCGV